ncbi:MULTISPECIES: hypothetical protein [unclassified Brevibacterium]|uniref:hypothetical protein n=1 Tax=unclassified Brevibacterium TaxID=2614124 RepID=UPI001E61402B|nr:MULTISPECIES: hypothetical protein [unclassified Brevibacterium]MCD1286507.1 hypothetical protein [Brevibacterium sp. CCUG 69071]MDK8434260.1 hypothetical protein [Brevibacterium sp. H-BE7]
MTEPRKYRKKPVEIEARRVPTQAEVEAKDARDASARMNGIFHWVEANTMGTFDCLPILRGDEDAHWPESGISIDPRDGRMVIATLEGGHWVNLGDYVIRGVQGEFYPCKPDIFHATYDEVKD